LSRAAFDGYVAVQVRSDRFFTMHRLILADPHLRRSHLRKHLSHDRSDFCFRFTH